LFEPTFVALDTSDNIFVADEANQRLLHYTFGDVHSTLLSQCSYPSMDHNLCIGTPGRIQFHPGSGLFVYCHRKQHVMLFDVAIPEFGDHESRPQSRGVIVVIPFPIPRLQGATLHEGLYFALGESIALLCRRNGNAGLVIQYWDTESSQLLPSRSCPFPSVTRHLYPEEWLVLPGGGAILATDNRPMCGLHLLREGEMQHIAREPHYGIHATLSLDGADMLNHPSLQTFLPMSFLVRPRCLRDVVVKVVDSRVADTDVVSRITSFLSSCEVPYAWHKIPIHTYVVHSNDL